MADTIRDVIIKLRIQQDAAKLQVPDFSEIEKAAKDAASRVSAAFSAAAPGASGVASNASSGGAAGVSSSASKGSRRATEDIDDLRERISQAEGLLKEFESAVESAGDAEKQALQPIHALMVQAINDKKAELAAAEESERVKTAAAEKFKQISVSEKIAAFNARKAAEEAAAADKEAARAKKELEEASRKAQAQLNRIAGDMRSAGEGAFRAARGIALWTATSDDQLQRMIKNVAAVQGAWDIASGSINVIRGLSSAMTVASAAGGTYAVVMTQVARAQTAVAVTATIASAAVKSLWGPVGAVLAVVTTVIAAGAIAWRSWAASQKEAEEAGKPVLDLMRQYGDAIRNKNQQVSLFDTEKSILDLQKFESAAEKAKAAAEIGGGLGRGYTVVKKAQEYGRLSYSRTNEENDKAVEKLQSYLAVNQKVVEREKIKLELIREQQKELDANLKKQKEILDTAKKSYEEEKKKVSTIQEQLGKLDAIQKAELERIGKRVKSGTASEGEYKRLEEYSGIETIGNFLKERNRKKGEGREDLLDAFNNGKPLTGQGSNLQEELDKYKKAADDTANLTKETLKRAAELKVQEQQQMKEVAQLLKDLYAEKSAVENLKLLLENQRREQDRRDLGKGR